MHAAEYIRIPLRRRDGTIWAHAIIDVEDAHLAVHRWCMDNDGYAVRALPRAGGRQPLARLHRVILGLVPGDGLQVDHIDRDPLNCRRANLRIATNAQNGQNRPSQAGSSRYRGVTWDRCGRKWKATARLNGVQHHLGYFDDELEAARVAQAWRIAHMPYTVEPALPLSPAPATM